MAPVRVLVRDDPADDDRLTPRDLEVLRLVAGGLSDGEIAAASVLRPATAETSASRILSRLDLRDRVQAVVHACGRGLVT